jgi:uncharacterized membrane protein YecN with MAPEG domain
MIKALQLLFTPVPTWERIALAQRGVGFVLFLYFIPAVLISVGAHGFTLVQWGQRGSYGGVVRWAPLPALQYVAVVSMLLLIAALLSAYILQVIATSVQVRVGFQQCFTTLAYSYGPLLLLRMLDILPMTPTWICWAAGAMLTASALYHGVAMVMKPEQTKGFGLFLVALLVTLLLSGLTHLVAVNILSGRVKLPGFGD